jgi:WD40 repeat protein
MYHKWAIENSPLQVYPSALIFSPARSLIRELFEQEKPEWITTKLAIQDYWSPCLQTLEGHSGRVRAVAFSPDGKLVVSGSEARMVGFWDAVTGASLQKLEGHSGWVTSVAFSPDGKLVVSRSDDRTVRLWDTATGAALQTLEGHSGWVSSVAS